MINIVHNEVCYTNYTGISVGYGWTSDVNAMSNNHIDSNNVHHVVQFMGDGAAIYTLSNQEPGSTLCCNYLHDFSKSDWADFMVNGIYLDEQTSGYSIAGNVFVNAPANVFHNRTGNNTESNNDGTSATTIANAGIEAAFKDIKNFIIPIPTEVITQPGPAPKTASKRFGPAAPSYRVYSLSGRYIGTVKSLSQKTIKPLLADGICLIRPENLTMQPGAAERIVISKVKVEK